MIHCEIKNKVTPHTDRKLIEGDEESIYMQLGDNITHSFNLMSITAKVTHAVTNNMNLVRRRGVSISGLISEKLKDICL